MTTMANLGACLRRLHRDERGMEVPSLILLLAFVVIPVIIALGHFSQDILDMLHRNAEQLRPGD
ncbi:hypothetical protein [Pinisolibacter aquiterrae]|jgi:hypothetical protein|uniref:hypothetical protein n=1 Tax=Pinisolibacter aquiterrae TaxID=2815579 RepID=UPI001C3CA555|nr:hypothetical protein [Pinisolibacter aquiterrae]MBV5266598.1 hypothetical protein [Pinisolibacter aquiterrae]MCC8234629.1 hypothetical protein [Pinisolibacter aquiterrae]